MPKQPAKNLRRIPSRSVYWRPRNLTTAWATVSRTVGRSSVMVELVMRSSPSRASTEVALGWWSGADRPRPVRPGGVTRYSGRARGGRRRSVERQPRIGRLVGPGRAHPGVVRVVTDSPGAVLARAGHHVQVVHVV